MSKAFAPGESDDDEERIIPKRPLLPPGTPNYITAEGARRLEAQRERLIAEKAALGDAVESKERARTLERHLDDITERLNAVQIVNLAKHDKDQIRFGATVTLRDTNGSTQTWRIVGIDEVDLTKGWVSWISPLARTLLDKRAGDTVRQGDQSWTVQNIDY